MSGARHDQAMGPQAVPALTGMHCGASLIDARDRLRTIFSQLLRKPGAADSEEDIRGWMNQQVGKTQRLSGLRFTDELPRSAIGKVLKRELRDLYLSASN